MTAINEEWRVVPSNTELMASSFGRVVRLPHCINGRTYTSSPTYGCRTKASKTAKHTYMSRHYRGIGNIKIHRMVCEVFHGPATDEKPYVLHKDGNSENNHFTNLEWGTQKDNLNHPLFIEYCRSRTGDNSPVVKGRLRE